MIRPFALLAIALGFALPACTPRSDELGDAQGKATTTVVWVSVDGLRGDYVSRTAAPFLTKLARESASTRHLRPAFPPITFPSHATEATGVAERVHGIPGNEFYDAGLGKTFAYPTGGEALRAEAIWTTATRQGIRTEVFDWPMSQVQSGPNAAAYWDPHKYDSAMGDEKRTERWVSTYERDGGRGERSLRLVMGYWEGVDKAGHHFGPESKEVDEAVLKADRELGDAFQRVKAAWQNRKGNGDRLVFMVTTDHGMSACHTQVNLPGIVGLPEGMGVVTASSGPVGHVFIPRDVPAREEMIKGAMERLGRRSYLKAFRREQLPAVWAYDAPERTGDIIVVLDRGYTFSKAMVGMEMRVNPVTGPLGMHGYPVEEDPEMEGFLAVWSSDGRFVGRDLGTVETLRLHASVAQWLGISPAKDAAPAAEALLR